jgi:large subunit ribosomal protein L20
MPRVRKGAARRRKHKKVLKEAKGYHGATSRHYRLAIQATLRARTNATRDRQLRKRDFRRLWITRITAACGQRGVRYSQFIHGLKEAGIELNRKMLSEVAIADPAAFDALVALATGEAPPKPEQPKKQAEAEAPAEEAEEKKTSKKAKKAKKATKKAAKKKTARKSEDEPTEEDAADDEAAEE